MVTLYHNPRCGKSRKALAELEANNIAFETRLYLNEPLSKDEIQCIMSKLSGDPKDLIRSNETEFKENYKGVELTEEMILEALTKYPKLLQRPILEYADNAHIIRTEEALNLIK